MKTKNLGPTHTLRLWDKVRVSVAWALTDPLAGGIIWVLPRDNPGMLFRANRLAAMAISCPEG